MSKKNKKLKKIVTTSEKEEAEAILKPLEDEVTEKKAPTVATSTDSPKTTVIEKKKKPELSTVKESAPKKPFTAKTTEQTVEEKVTTETIKKKKPKSTIEYDNDGEEKSDDFVQVITEKKKQRRKIFFISTLIFFVISIIALLTGYFYFSKIQPFAEEKIELQIVGPEKVKTAEEVTYAILYSNQGEISIDQAKLYFQKPHGFIITSSTPELINNAWTLETVQANQSGEVKVNGYFIDNIDTKQEIKTTLSFYPQNFSSEFSTDTNYFVSIEQLEFEIETQSPQNITLGEKISIKLDITNKNLEPLSKLRVTLQTPDNLEILSTLPKTTENKPQWLLTDIEPASKTEITLEAKFPENLTFPFDEARDKEFKILLEYPNEDEQYFKQYEQDFKIRIVDQELVSYLIVNGSTENKNVSLGDDLNFSLVYKNKGENEYKNLQVSAIIDILPKDIIDWSKIEDENFGKIEKTATGKIITWADTQIPELETILAEQEGTINFSLPIKSFADIEDTISINELSQSKIQTYAKLILTNDNGEELPSIESSKIDIQLNSDLNFTSKALYFYEDGTPIGIGPLPPEVNQTTTYVVFWDLTNKLHELENIKITASVPDNVRWTDNKIITVGEIDYDNKQITWTINRLPTSAQTANLTFHLELTPDSQDIGRLMKLLNNVTLTATDSVTQDTITQTVGVTTTNLEYDEFGIGRGIVIERE